MSDTTRLIVEKAVEWFRHRQAFLAAENNLDNPDWRLLLNECSNGEHALAAAVREYLRETGQ
jgi:hypothetical protein